MIIAEANFDNLTDRQGNPLNFIRGSVFFTQMNSDLVRVDIQLYNVPDGIHGIHIHENPVKISRKYELIQECCETAGGHFNGPMPKWSPKKAGTPHGSWRFDTQRHVGDLCNNVISMQQTVNFSYYDELISLLPNHPHNIVGRSLVIHAYPDDEGFFEQRFRNFFHNLGVNYQITPETRDKMINSKITGNAGPRIGCANVELLF